MIGRPAKTFVAGLALAASLGALLVLAGGVGAASSHETAFAQARLAAATDDESAAEIPLCTVSTTQTSGSRPPVLTESDFSGVIQNGDDLVRQTHPDEAKELYRSVLDAEGADAQARTCAATGLAKIVIDAPDAPSNPISDLSKSVASFGSSYLTPLWNVLLPFAILVVVFLLIAKVSTRFLVTTDEVMDHPTWLYVCCGWLPILVGAALLLLAPPTGIGWWLLLPGGAIIALNALYLSNLNNATRPTRLVLAFACGVLIVPLILVLIGLGMAGTLAMGLASAGFGIVAIGYSRGLRKELSIEGMKADGTPDAGVSQLMRVALSDMCVSFPRGAMMPVSTDVSSLQQEALSILPEGTWAKVGAFLVSLTRPPRPWRVLLTCVDEVTIEVILTRNGRFADGLTIRSGDFGWPAADRPAVGPAEVEAKESDASGAVTPGDLTVAAAAFVLLALSTRHPDLARGLNGATRWASVAAQVIATAERPKSLSAAHREQLLANAVAMDHNNLSAQLAFVVERFARNADQNSNFQAELEKLRTRVELPEGTVVGDMAALRLRLGFNLLVAYTNTWLAADGRNRADARGRAREAGNQLIGSLNAQGSSGKDLQPLVREIRRSTEVLLSILTDGVSLNEDVDGALSMYEIACAHAFAAESTPARWTASLDWLERATLADPSNGAWARSDPSFRGLTIGFGPTEWTNTPAAESAADDGRPRYQHLTRFRQIVGDTLPKSFTDLDDIKPHIKELAARGITSAADVAQLEAWWIADELGLSRAVTGRWAQLARLHEYLPKDRRAILVLLVTAGVDSVDSLRRHIVGDDDTKRADLARALIAAAADGDIVPPSEAALRDLPNWSADGARMLPAG